MRELPMLLNGDGVRATMDGRKVMTRRPIMRHAPEWTWAAFMSDPDYTGHWRVQSDKYTYMSWVGLSLAQQLEYAKRFSATFNPLGVPGDLLYVRETCRAVQMWSGGVYLRYIADHALVVMEDSDEAMARWSKLYFYRQGQGRTVPNIHMPKWAARTWCRNTGVRVEKGPHISEEDAVAEGFESADAFTAWWAKQYPGMDWRFVTSYEVIER